MLQRGDAESLIFLVGSLLAALGVHRGQLRLLFVNDGARWIRDWFEGLNVPDKRMVPCWYHLAKRCFDGLATACGRKRGEEIAQEVLGHLWEGRVDEALAVLTSRRPEMKVRLALDQLVQYIEKPGHICQTIASVGKRACGSPAIVWRSSTTGPSPNAASTGVWTGRLQASWP